ncbi:MAG: hypothetical protein EVA89_26935 [Sandaracinaceae bacterium]|nr:MAG: hypothetical protein EVA89_26935 [Sandaracinaceae bacterium]
MKPLSCRARAARRAARTRSVPRAARRDPARARRPDGRRGAARSRRPTRPGGHRRAPPAPSSAAARRTRPRLFRNTGERSRRALR